MSYLDEIIIGLSPLTERIYIGKQSKKNSNEWAGEKRDITSEFLDVVIQKFTRTVNNPIMPSEFKKGQKVETIIKNYPTPDNPIDDWKITIEKL